MAATAAGFVTHLIDHDALCGSSFDGDLAVRSLAPVLGEPIAVLYRGWMINIPEAYAAFENALSRKGYSLITKSQVYNSSHFLPGWYHEIVELTPVSFWFEKSSEPFDAAAIAEELAAKWGEGGAVVKDYVKSRKDEWLDACYIPNCADTANATRVLTNFIDRQGQLLSGGVVLRQFEQWNNDEFRLWFYNGELFYATNRDGQVNIDFSLLDFSFLKNHTIVWNRPFISVDVVLNARQEWRVIEVGDGQVSGLPVSCDHADFYAALLRAVPTRE